VYLPALNEAATIGALLDAIPRDIPGVAELETIVVDDGSTDRTAAVAERHGARVVRHPRNLGTGRAFMSGVQSALADGADVIVGIDADGQFSPADIRLLVAPIVTGEADVALCTRFGPNSKLTGRMPWTKRAGNWLLCKIISLTAGQEFTDVSCGFRAFTRDAALRVDVHSDFEYIHESLLAWRRFGQRVVEVELPVRAERAIGESRIASSLSYYALRAGPVLVGAIRDYSPQFVRSLEYAGLATSIALVVSYPVAYWIAFRGGRWKNLLLLFIVAPFFVTYLIRTLAWQTILSDHGFVVQTLQHLHVLGSSGRLLATGTAVVAGITYNFLPFMALPLYVSLEQVDPRLIEAAEDLYASKLHAFLRVTLPLSLPGVVAGTLLTFIPAAGDFINAQLLGGPDNHMIGNVIESKFLELTDYPAAASMSFILMAAILVFVVVYSRVVGSEQLTGTAA